MKGNGKATWAAAGLLVGLAAALTLPSLAQTPSPSDGAASDRIVAVTGTATIRSAPDEATVTLGVQTQAPSAEEAMQQNADRMESVIRALQDQGVSPDQIATAWVNLYPNYSSDGIGIAGYSADNQLTVTIRDLDRIGHIIDTAIEAGANLTSGLSFRVTDQNEGRDRALEQAIADARHQAEVLAQATGNQLGAVVSIGAGSGGVYPPVMYERAAADAAGSVPIEPPTIETQVTVTVVYGLV